MNNSLLDQVLAEYQAHKQEEAKRIEDAETWERDRRVDAALMEGVEDGLTFAQFSHNTGCPWTLQPRYKELQQKSGISPGKKEREAQDELFLKGFRMSEK